MAMTNNINGVNCARKKLKPWLIGLVGLVVVIAFFLIFRIVQNTRKNPAGGTVNANVNTSADNNAFAGSYHQIVDIIRPAVVGISLPGSVPNSQSQALSWWHCPMCRVSTTIPFNKGVCPRCPMCSRNMQLQNPNPSTIQAQPKAFGVV